MVNYVQLVSFTDQGIRNVKDTVKRAEAFKEMAKAQGCTVKEIFWTQGAYDLVTVVEAPDETTALALNISICKAGNIRTQTLRAFSQAEISKVLAKVS